MTPEAREVKRKYDREAKARQRASMSVQERAESRRDHDAAFRDAHREARREYDRARYRAKAVSGWQPSDSVKHANTSTEGEQS